MTAPSTLTRHANLNDLVQILRGEHARKLDVVVPVSQLRAESGRLVLVGADAEITEDGVTTTDGIYLPTAICDDGLADKFGIPPGYLARLRNKNLTSYDQNVNGWLTHEDYAGKNYLVRCLRNDDQTVGVARAFLSDSYKPIDNLDVLMTILEGVQAAGVDCDVESCDLSDRRMYIRIRAEGIAVNALELVKNYRSPFSGKSGKDLPMVFAGLEASNSEVGHGAFSIAPRVILQVCDNGAVSRADAIRSQHLGGKLEPGQIVWSDETQAKNLELIKSKTVDAVRQFLSPEWVQKTVDEMSAQAGIEINKPEDVIKHVATKLRYSEAQQDDILSMFIKGADPTTGGVMQAVTASAQNQTNADTAADMEADALRVLSLAVAYATRS